MLFQREGTKRKKRKWARRKRMKGNGGRWGRKCRTQTGVMAKGVPQVLTTGFYGSRYKEPCVGSRGRSLSTKTRCAPDTRPKHCGKALISPLPPAPHCFHPPHPTSVVSQSKSTLRSQPAYGVHMCGLRYIWLLFEHMPRFPETDFDGSTLQSSLCM